jgi:hypothetical protein
MIRRALLVVLFTACCLPAQLQLFVIQGNSEAPVTDEYGFGTISTCDFLDISFRLRNTGTSPTPLTVLSLAGVGFSFINPPQVPQTVSAGASLDFQIQFAPTAPGSYNANFTADGVSAIVFGYVLAAPCISLQDGSGAPPALMAGATIDFGNVVRGSTGTQQVTLTNPGAGLLKIQHIAVVWVAPGVAPGPAPFEWKNIPLPLALKPGASATMEVDFTPTTNGPHQGWALDIEQRSFTLQGTGIDPPFPHPEISLAVAAQSSQQGALTVRLDAASQATGTGQVEMDFTPRTPGSTDSGILFLSGGNRTATFSVNQGDSVGHFGSEDSAAFQTGTTAGDIVFKVTLGNSTAQTTLTIAPAAIGLESTKAQRTSGGLDLLITAFDNMRSASKLTFKFYDQSGNLLSPGAMTVDSSSAFQQFFGSSDLGGVFSLHAFFPVTGNPNQVESVDVGMINSVGTVETGLVHFTTP